MKISKNSLSYKFIDRWRDAYIPDNLCAYMKMFMFTLLFVTAIAFFIGLVFGIPIFMGPFIWYQHLTNDLPLPWKGDGAMAMWFIIFHIELTIVVIVGIFVLLAETPTGQIISKCASVSTEFILNIVDSTEDRLSGNIFWEWIKAAHKKICPQLEFTNDKQ